MKFKKLVSAASALAIAVSAFAGLTITASAADVVYERTASTWTSADVGDGQWSSGTVTEGTGLVISYNNGSASTSKSLTSSVKANDLVEITGTWKTGGASGRSGSYDYVGFGNSLQLQDNTQDQKVYISVNGTQTTIISGSTRSQTYTFDVIIDTATNTLKQFKVGGTDYISSLENTTLNDTAIILSLGHYKAGRENYGSSTTLSAIKVETTAQQATTVDYTIKYVDTEGNELKDSATRTNVVGATASATTDDTADFDKDGKRYSINSEKSTNSITLGETASNNVITLVFDAHEATTVPVTAKAGDVEIATYDAIATYIDYPYSFGPYAYIKYGNDYYKYNGIAADGSVPAVTGTATETSSIVLNYTKVDNVVWYTEVDSNNYSGHSPFAKPADDNNASGGKNGGAVYGQAGATIDVGTFTAEVAGTYKVTYNALSTTSSTRSCYFAIDTTNTAEATLDSCNNGEFKTFEHSVHLSAGEHAIKLLSNDSAGFYADYMVIELVEADTTTNKYYSAVAGDTGFSQIEVTATNGTETKTGSKTLETTVKNTTVFVKIADVPEGVTITKVTLK